MTIKDQPRPRTREIHSLIRGLTGFGPIEVVLQRFEYGPCGKESL